MKRTILFLATAATAIFATASPTLAAPFNPKDVAADPALLVHVDCDALRASSVGRSILADPEVQDKLSAIGAIFDFDLRTQLHGLTVYTTEQHPKDGALIVYADFDPNRLITLAKVAKGFESLTNNSHAIYSWLDDRKKSLDGERPRVFGAILGHRVIFGQSESHLAEALEVIDGKAASYSGKGLPESADGESILVQGAMHKFDLDNAGPEATIFKMAKSVRLILSEGGANMNLGIRFEAVDDGTASEINMVAQGLVALFKLQKTDSDTLKLANAIAIKQDGATVGVTLSIPSADVPAMIANGEEKRKAKEEAQETNSPAVNKQ